MRHGAYRIGRLAGGREEPPAADAPVDAAIGFGIGGDVDEGHASGAVDEVDTQTTRPPTADRILPALAIAAALSWIAAVAIAAAAAARGGITPIAVVKGAALLSGPLALLATLLLLWQRGGAHGIGGYVAAARGVRQETLALDAVLGLASRRLAEDRAGVAAEAERLVALADGSSAKVREATDGMAREIAALGARARELDEAAGTARVDLGVLLADVPIAEAQVRALSEELRGTGLAAHEQASALGATLAGLAARAKEAEEANAGAANRLAAQAARVASASTAAAHGIAEAEDRLGAGIDGVLSRAAQAVERTHAGLVAQGEAIDAMVTRAAAAADAAAARAGDVVGGRIAALAAEIEALGALLARHDGEGEAGIGRIRQGLAAVEARFIELDETGRARTERLGEALGQLWAHAEKTMAALNGGGTAATTLINRTETLHAGVRACLDDLDGAIPGAFDRLDARAAAAGPEIASIGETATRAADAIAQAGAGIEARHAAIDGFADALAARLASARAEAKALEEAVASAGTQAASLADGATPRLVEALVRVRETGVQAAERAREAFAAVVPDSARAIDAAVGDAVAAQIARVTTAGDRAAAQARQAAERIEAGVARIERAGTAAEERVAQSEAALEAADRDHLSRRAAELVEALNSAAIDVSRLIEADPGDAAWSAYLKGDRGVFTRRAVRLLGAAEAKAVAARYGEDEAFRAGVNRYVHDFEALLRPVLAMRDGSALAVVLLSSEMGKLYVALAQAIERLRA